MIETPYAHVGRLLRAHRGGESIVDVSHVVGVSWPTLDRVEAGEILPSMPTFAKLVRHYRTRPGVPPMSDAAVVDLVVAMGVDRA